jgi:acetylornithine/N-succinyldiaminopimelate aminotransferase
MAKALGCGFPVGALLVGDKAAETLQFGSHGTTFGGNPMATSVALAALRVMQTPALQENIVARSKQLFATLEGFQKELGIFTEVRGRGLMVGAELKPELHGKANEIMELARQYGVLILVAGPNVLRFLPPLNITEAELTEGMSKLGDALREYVSKQ